MRTEISIPNKSTFGPGSMERVTLTSWVDKHGNRWVRVKGWVTIYRGDGGDTEIMVDCRDHYTSLIDYIASDAPEGVIRGVTLDDMAAQLVEWDVEQWMEENS